MILFISFVLREMRLAGYQKSARHLVACSRNFIRCFARFRLVFYRTCARCRRQALGIHGGFRTECKTRNVVAHIAKNARLGMNFSALLTTLTATLLCCCRDCFRYATVYITCTFLRQRRRRWWISAVSSCWIHHSMINQFVEESTSTLVNRQPWSWQSGNKNRILY